MDEPSAAQIEVASWQLAATLLMRHPQLRLFRGYPGGGQYDVLWLQGRDRDPCDIRLNRNGTIQVWHRSGVGPVADWTPAGWAEYLASDREEFTVRLQAAASLTPRRRARAPVPRTVAVGALAQLARRLAHLRGLDIQLGYSDTSGYGGGPNPVLSAFAIDRELLLARPDDWFGESGYRFWVVFVAGEPLLAIETSSATAWRLGHTERLDLMAVFRQCGRSHRRAAAQLHTWAGADG